MDTLTAFGELGFGGTKTNFIGVGCATLRMVDAGVHVRVASAHAPGLWLEATVTPMQIHYSRGLPQLIDMQGCLSDSDGVTFAYVTFGALHFTEPALGYKITVLLHDSVMWEEFSRV